MEKKLFDSELKVMELLWEQGAQSAKDIAAQLKEQVGWSKTTTYTVIKKCIDKGAILRQEPNFICQAVISRSQIQELETRELIDKHYGGSADLLVASLLSAHSLSPQEIQQLKELIQNLQ